MTEDKEHQAVTRGIKHWGLGGYTNILPRIKFGVTGQESSPQSPTFHTANRYRQTPQKLYIHSKNKKIKE